MFTAICQTRDADWTLRASLARITDDQTLQVDEKVAQVCTSSEERRRHVRATTAGGAAQPTSKYLNCFAYAFGLAPHVTEIERMGESTDGRIFVSPSFVQHLRETVFLMRPADAVADGDFVVYYTSDLSSEHAGVAAGNFVVSKWGRLPVFEHGFWDVPDTFGNNIRAFARIEPDHMWQHFRDWAKEQNRQPAPAFYVAPRRK